MAAVTSVTYVVAVCGGRLGAQRTLGGNGVLGNAARRWRFYDDQH